METPLPSSSPREGLGRLGVKLYRYRNLVIRHWWILALTIGLGLAYQAWVLSQKPRVHQSTSQIEIKEELTDLGRVINTGSQENFVGTQMSIIKSARVIGDAREAVAFKYPQYAGSAARVPEIAVSMIPRTQIFVITGTGPDPEYTQRFVDSLVDSFIEYRRVTKGDAKGTLLVNMEHQIAKLQADLAEADAKLRAFTSANKIGFWEEQMKSSPKYLSELKDRQAKIQTELNRMQTIAPDNLLMIPPAMPAAVAPQSGGAGAPETGSSAATMPAGSELYSIYLQKTQELSAAQSRLDEKSKVWKPKHPRLIALKEDVATIEHSIELVKRQNRDSIAQRIEAYKSELMSLEVSIKTWEQKVQEAGQKNDEFLTLDGDKKRLTQELATAKNNYAALQATMVMDVFRVIQKATPPELVAKQTVRHLGMGALAGLFIGFVILVLLDRADDRMTSSSEILDQFSEPILGQIPNVADSRGAAGLPLLQPDDERYTYAEAFRSLRSSLIFMPNQAEMRTILITSAIPNEGKSTIASNLAITMAAAGANVVLVDADLRRGDIASLFDIDGRTGLSNVLRSEVSWEDATQTCKYPNLAIIPRGPVTNQSSELLLLPSIHTLLDGLKDNFDLVIFNTAPIL
ncbi:MAG TPA: AAA family ATPase, partial [Chthoniobacteraceae bacterium]|nr:AAA family ATPase [Chthoniobacteraceae bacterium]